jgi:hypothetical protein
LGWPSVEWGLKNISSRELSEWQAYARLEPFGEQRADLRAGIIAAVIASAFRNPKKRKDPFSPADFMPVFSKAKAEAEAEEQSPGQMLAFVEILNAMYGGKDLRQPSQPSKPSPNPSQREGDKREGKRKR